MHPQAAVAMMEPMPLAQAVEIRGTQGRARIEQAVSHVDNPGRQRKQDGDPKRENNMRGPRKSKRPDQGDRGGIETSQVPVSNQGWRVYRANCCEFAGRGSG
jgi:hypothetical protein